MGARLVDAFSYSAWEIIFPYGRTESQSIALKMGKVEDFYSKKLESEQ